MTESKRKAIMNASTFDELLDAEYGVTGTPERDKFEAHAKAYAKAETDDNISLTQYEEAKTTIERLMPIATEDMQEDNPNAIKLIEAYDEWRKMSKEIYILTREEFNNPSHCLKVKISADDIRFTTVSMNYLQQIRFIRP